MKRKILISLITISILLEGVFIYHLFSPTNNKLLEEVNTKDLSSNDKSIAIMVQNEDDSWEEATDRSKWPSKEDYGYMGAECTDSDGAKIDVTNILKFNLMTNHATIDTKNSIYCTLYFAKGRPLLQALEETKGLSLNLTSAVDGMYRYKGTSSVVNNNYICFGTSDKTECLNKPDTYMYRIIGITSADDNTIGLKKDQLKLIKATPSSTSQAWSGNSDVKWDSSSAKSHIISYYNTYIYGATPNGTYWDSIVTEHKWYNVDQPSNATSIEPKTSQSIASKVSLMYGSDYYNSGTQDTNNWLFIINGWNTNSSLSGNSATEWTMTRRGKVDRGYAGWYVLYNGTLGNWNTLNEQFSVRPVFYLQPQINLTGKGTVDDPFRIRSMNNVS